MYYSYLYIRACIIRFTPQCCETSSIIIPCCKMAKLYNMAASLATALVKGLAVLVTLFSFMNSVDLSASF